MNYNKCKVCRKDVIVIGYFKKGYDTKSGSVCKCENCDKVYVLYDKE